MQELLTKAEAAKVLKISQRTLDRIRSEGKLRSVHVESAVRFTVAELDRYIAEQTA